MYATGDDIRTEEQLWSAIVQDYSDGLNRAYSSETEQAFVEYRDRLPLAKSLYYGYAISQG